MTYRPASPRRSHRNCPSGLTLLELLLALGGATFVGLTIAVMLSAVAYGTTSQEGMRELVVRQKAVAARLTAAIRGARAVLDVADPGEPAGLVLWLRDTNGNGIPEASEIRRITLDSSGNEGRMTCYRLADNASDIRLDLASDFGTITADWCDTGVFTGTLWARGIMDGVFRSDQPAPNSRLVTAELELAARDTQESTIITAALRQDFTER